MIYLVPSLQHLLITTLKWSVSRLRLVKVVPMGGISYIYYGYIVLSVLGNCIDGIFYVDYVLSAATL